LARNVVLLFSLDQQQRHWTIHEPGIFLLRVCEDTLDSISKWRELSEVEGDALLNDPHA
jgi:hypothetical protein